MAIAGGAVAGVAAVTVGVPAVLGYAGFTAGGIVAGSVAATGHSLGTVISFQIY